MNEEALFLPKIYDKIFKLQNESNNKRNLILTNDDTSNSSMNKIVKNCMYKKNKLKLNIKFKKEFSGFQKPKRYFLNYKNNNDALIKNMKNMSRDCTAEACKLSSIGINNNSNLQNSENTFYKYFKNENQEFKINKKLTKYNNIFLETNILNAHNNCKTTRKYSKRKNYPIKSISQKKINNINNINVNSNNQEQNLYCQLNPYSIEAKKLQIINNKNKSNKVNNSVEYSKIKLYTNQKRLFAKNDPSSIDITSVKNENEYNLLKNRIKKNFFSSMRKSLFSTKNNENNIKKDYIDHIRVLSFKGLSEQISNSRIVGKNSKFYDGNNSNKNEIGDYELFNEKNDLDIFLRILIIHLKIEKAIMKSKKNERNNNLIYKENEKNNGLIISDRIIILINDFFGTLKLVSFDIDFFVEINKNRLIRKIIKILISYYSYLLILLKLTSDENAIVEIVNSEIFHQISKILYNIFEYYILPDLNNNEYNLKFLDFFKEITKINRYIIKNKDQDILYTLIKKTDNCLNMLKIKIENEIKNEIYSNLNPVFNSISLMLININNKSILTYINNSINVILYSILDKNNINLDNNKYDRIKINDSVPYLPPIDNKYKYTLVLDMDETLIHFVYRNKNIKNMITYDMIEQNDLNQLGMFLLRPYTKYFFEKLKNLYEIIIFTNGIKEYCDKILSLIDPNLEYIKFRLFRKHSISKDNDIKIKDLSLLGRDLSKIIIIANSAKNYKLQEDNGLPISSWKGDVNDTALKNLLPILKNIAENDVQDVRKIIVKIKEKLSEIKTDNYMYINDYEMFIDKTDK